MKKLTFREVFFLAFIAVEFAIYVTFIVMASVKLPDPIYVKYAGVLLCLAVSVVFLCLPARNKDNAIMTAAFVFTAISDLFILVLDKYYEIGLVTFILTQSVYLYRLYADRLKKIVITLSVRLAVMATLIIVLAALGKINLLVAECAIYITMLVGNVVDAFIVCKGGLKNLLFAIGLLLFLGCDICVGLDNMGKVLNVQLPSLLISVVSFAIWAFYLPSQVVIALTIKKSEPVAVNGNSVENLAQASVVEETDVDGDGGAEDVAQG